MDTGTSLDTVHEEEVDNAPSNEQEEMRGSEKEENSTVSEKPKDRDLNKGPRGDPSFDLNANCSGEKLTRSVWELEKSNKKQKLTGIPYSYLY